MTAVYFLFAIIFAISTQLSSCIQCGSLTIKCNTGDLSCYSGPCASTASHLIGLNRLPLGTYSPTTKPTNFPTTITVSPTAPTSKPTFPMPLNPINYIHNQQRKQTMPYNTPNVYPINVITRLSTADTIITKTPTSYPTIKPTPRPTANPINKPTTNPTNKPVYIWRPPVAWPQQGGGGSSSSSSDDAMFKNKQSHSSKFDVIENEENNLNDGKPSEKKNILIYNKVWLWIILMSLSCIILFGICYKCISMSKNSGISNEERNEESECILYSGDDEHDYITENTSDIDSDEMPTPAHVAM